MVFLKSWDTPVVDGTKTVSLVCTHCNNQTEHQVRVVYFGPSIGIVFMKTPLLSMKKYYLVCPTCANATQQLTKEQVNALKG